MRIFIEVTYVRFVIINDKSMRNIFRIQDDNCITIPMVSPTMAILFLPPFDSVRRIQHGHA